MTKGKDTWRLALYVGWPILAVLNALDVWSTNSLLNTYRGVAEEANPFTRWFIDHSLFIPVKVLLVLAVGVLCLKTRNPRKFAVMIWLIVPIYVFTVVHNIGYM